MRTEEAQKWIDIGDATEARLTTSRSVFVKAVKAVIDAANDYLPPDGISKHRFINRVLGATDNAEIVTALKEIEEEEKHTAEIKARYA